MPLTNPYQERKIDATKNIYFVVAQNKNQLFLNEPPVDALD